MLALLVNHPNPKGHVNMPTLPSATPNVEIKDKDNFEACLSVIEEGKVITTKVPESYFWTFAPLKDLVVEGMPEALTQYNLDGYCAIYYKTNAGYIVVEGTKNEESFEWSIDYSLVSPMSLRIELKRFIATTLTDKDNVLNFFIGNNLIERYKRHQKSIIERINEWLANPPSIDPQPFAQAAVDAGHEFGLDEVSKMVADQESLTRLQTN